MQYRIKGLPNRISFLSPEVCSSFPQGQMKAGWLQFFSLFAPFHSNSRQQAAITKNLITNSLLNFIEQAHLIWHSIPICISDFGQILVLNFEDFGAQHVHLTYWDAQLMYKLYTHQKIIIEIHMFLLSSSIGTCLHSEFNCFYMHPVLVFRKLRGNFPSEFFSRRISRCRNLFYHHFYS